MPPLVTANAVIQCVHGGRVTLVPRQTTVLVSGAGPLLCEGDLIGAPIVGCPLASPGTNRMTVISTLPGVSTSLGLAVGGAARARGDAERRNGQRPSGRAHPRRSGTDGPSRASGADGLEGEVVIPDDLGLHWP